MNKTVSSIYTYTRKNTIKTARPLNNDQPRYQKVTVSRQHQLKESNKPIDTANLRRIKSNGNIKDMKGFSSVVSLNAYHNKSFKNEIDSIEPIKTIPKPIKKTKIISIQNLSDDELEMTFDDQRSV